MTLLFPLENEIQKIFDSFFQMSPQATSKPPRIWEWEYDGDKCIGMRLQAALSGFKKEEIDIAYESNSLKISGSNLKNTNINSKFRSEFSWLFSVPERYFDVDKIDPNYQDGLLDIRIPLKEQPQPPRRQIALK